MSESVITPIFLGAAVNVVVFFILLYVFRNNAFKATHVTLIASILVLAISFVIGGWVGMGIGVVSLGMFISSIVLYVFNFTSFKNLFSK